MAYHELGSVVTLPLENAIEETTDRDELEYYWTILVQMYYYLSLNAYDEIERRIKEKLAPYKWIV